MCIFYAPDNNYAGSRDNRQIGLWKRVAPSSGERCCFRQCGQLWLFSGLPRDIEFEECAWDDNVEIREFNLMYSGEQLSSCGN